MAQITLTSSSLLAVARRKLRRSAIALTVRNNKVFTYTISRPHNPRTIRQQSNRSTFSRANAIVARQLKQPRLLRHWRIAARRLGYRTARGAAIAFWCNLLRHSLRKPLNNNITHHNNHNNHNLTPTHTHNTLTHTFFLPQHIPIATLHLNHVKFVPI
ncbi:MAG: hypothetical protein MJZ15_00020 [Bacteroidales bacterium]|nr:hypothetical protein [Bacteroidales bacterium]